MLQNKILTAFPYASLGGYGFCYVPAAPGMFELDCPTWLPQVWILSCQICADIQFMEVGIVAFA
jgi:hypothetical protein